MGTTAAQLETEAAIWRSLTVSKINDEIRRVEKLMVKLRAAGRPDLADAMSLRAEALEWAAMVVRRSN